MSQPEAPQYLIAGTLDPQQFGAFMPPGLDADGKPLRAALLIVSPAGLFALQNALRSEAVLGVVVESAPLVLAGLELCRVELRITPSPAMPWTLIVIRVEGYQVHTLGVLAHGAGLAHQIAPQPQQRVIVPTGEVPDA